RRTPTFTFYIPLLLRATPPTHIHPLPLHDALPISPARAPPSCDDRRDRTAFHPPPRRWPRCLQTETPPRLPRRWSRRVDAAARAGTSGTLRSRWSAARQPATAPPAGRRWRRDPMSAYCPRAAAAGRGGWELTATEGHRHHSP